MQELPAVKDELHEMRQFVKMAASAANGELQDALLALERDLEVVKKKVNGGLLACLGADAPSLTGMARQQDLLEVTNSLGSKVDRTELQVRCCSTRPKNSHLVWHRMPPPRLESDYQGIPRSHKAPTLLHVSSQRHPSRQILSLHDFNAAVRIVSLRHAIYALEASRACSLGLHTCRAS
ncbi:MAG: hypothetical protein HC767_03180 [Akkermansiaceae bacterium]|nr:hypothetical protein [Akkermansiaceae bacterium]